jgi:hypothetical protein
VPSGAFAVQLRAGRIPNQADEFLASRLRPIRGGISHGPPVSDGGPRCTVGLIVTWGGIPALMTASHCTQVKWGGDSHANFLSQPQTPEYVFGPELKDRPGRHCGPLDLARCRRADVALYHVSGVDVIGKEQRYAHGEIAQPIEFAAGPIGVPSSRLRSPIPLRVVGTVEVPVNLQIVHRIGWKTGGLYGPVVETCADYGEAQPGWPWWETRYLLCQSVAITASDGGDSGGPVFVHLGGDSVLFAGIHHGSDDSGPYEYMAIFSSVGQIRSELFQEQFRFHPNESPPPPATVQISGPNSLQPGNLCMWWATTDIASPMIEWYVADTLIGAGPLLTYAPLSSTTLVVYAVGSGSSASTSFEVSVGMEHAPCADQ